MFSRVAACGIAACLFVIPVASSGKSEAVADVKPPAATAVSAQVANPDRERSLSQDSAHGDIRASDVEAPLNLAAFDPAEPVAQPPVPAAPFASLPSIAGPFGLSAVPVTSGDILAKWNGVENDIRAESDILVRCRVSTERCPTVAKDFLAIIAEGRAQTGRARIGIINRAINLAIRPMSDLEQWGVLDRWSAPLDTFTTRFGDCEDYAIAKYVALKEAGLTDDDVKLVIVRDLAVNEDHAVVAARLGGGWIVLDNRWLQLVEDNEVPRILPLFVLDQNGVRRFLPGTAPVASRAAAPAAFRD